MRWFLVFGLLIPAGCASYQPPTDIGVENSGISTMSYGEAWETAISYFANNGIPLKNVAKDSGLIAAEYGLAADDSLLDCGTLGTYDVFQSRTADINVLLRDKEDGSTDIRVNVFGNAVIFDNLNKTPRSVRCQSRGTLEEQVLRSLGAK